MAQIPPVAEQPPESLNIQKFSGLKNIVSPERLGPDELQIARNIDLDHIGQVRRRRGYKLAAAGNYHSLYKPSAQRHMYVVKDGNLGILYSDCTFNVLKSNVGTDRLAYVEVADKTYFSSATSSGVINPDHTVSPWGATTSEGMWLSPIVNPTQTLNPIFGTVLKKPPLATALAYYNGRIYLAEGKTVWATELYLYDYVDKTKNWLQFESNVTMLASVADGFYVGTETDVWFLTGPLKEMRRLKVHPYRAVPGSAVSVPTAYIDTQRISTRTAVMFLTDLGLCTGLDGGYVSGVTHDRVWFPKADSAAAMFRVQDGYTQYVGVTDSGGSPSSKARIGDYIDAEIRRFKGA